MLFFYRSIFAQVLLNGYFLFRIRQSKAIPVFLKRLFYLLYGLETTVYLTGLIIGESLPVRMLDLIHEINGIWVVGQFYLLLLLSLFDLIHYCNRKWSLFVRFRGKTGRKIRTVCFVTCSICIGIQLYGGYRHFRCPVVKTYAFTFNKTADTSTHPKATYKMLAVSDLHLGYIVGKRSLDNYVKLINDQQADIVIIDGDLIDYTLRPLIEDEMAEMLRQIRATKGVFFIPGNHEYKCDTEANFDWLAQSGQTILKDSVANIDNRLLLIGRDDDHNDDRMPINELMAKADTAKPRILLVHQPSELNDACKYNIPLTVCGHTHAGQVFPFNVLLQAFFPCSYGWGRQNNCCYYVTSGLGLSGFPLRIATHSEIVVFNMEIY